MKESSSKKTLFASFAVAVLAAALFAFAGCGSNGMPGSSANTGGDTGSTPTAEDMTIKVAATSTPHADILDDAVAPLLEEQGYTLEVQRFDDYTLPNDFTENGDVDANFFQHEQFLDNYNEENGTDLVDVADVHIEPMSVYANDIASFDDLPEGATVSVPNDPTNRARALKLLEESGLIELNPAVGDEPTAYDIVDNPRNLQILEVDAASVASTLPGVELAVVNTNFALEANLSEEDILATEQTDPTYANVLVVTDENEDSPKTQALVEAITSVEVADYIEDNFDGAVIPVSS